MANLKRRLTKRDLTVLYALHKLRVLDIETATMLCGFTQYCKCANRLSILCNEKYINYYQESIVTKKYYFITRKGMNVLFPNRNKKPPRFKITTLNHELSVAKVLGYILKMNSDLTIEDFCTDREMRMDKDYSTLKREHFCDLFCSKYRTKIEVELSSKKKSDLSKNYYFNSSNYVQIWITDRKQVFDRINNLKSEHNGFTTVVMMIDDLKNENINLLQLYNQLFINNPMLKQQLEHLEMLKMEKRKQLSIDDVI